MHNSINRKNENHLIFIGKAFCVFFAGFWVDERTEPGSLWNITGFLTQFFLEPQIPEEVSVNETIA